VGDDGEEEAITHITLVIYAKVNILIYGGGAATYGFATEQIEITNEMMSSDYYSMYAELLCVDLLDGQT
jgi:chromate transport protein ChrA